MIVAGSANPLLLASAGGYNLTRSLRFRSSASAYLNRTIGSNGSSTTFTWSGWVKRGSLTNASDQWLFGSTNYLTTGSGNPFTFEIIFKGTDSGSDLNKIVVGAENNASSPLVLSTTQVFRDPSAWYHIVVAIDTTQATSSNRAKLYINGVQVTSFGTATYPTQNTALGVNQSGNTPTIGCMNLNSSATRFFDGYITELNFIDGQALTPSSFGETSTTTGVWQPKKYAGTYGTNGFYLPFTDNSALTSGSNAGLGKDFSGNGNYWTTNNISITSGSTYDSMTDVPTLTSATQANFATFNPVIGASASGWYAPTFTNGNLNYSTSMSANSVGGNFNLSTMQVNYGKWYAEFTIGTRSGIPVAGNDDFGVIVGIPPTNTDYAPSIGVVYKATNGQVRIDGAGGVSYGNSYTTGDVVGVALDMISGKVWFSKNGTWQNSGDPVAGTNPAASSRSGLYGIGLQVNTFANAGAYTTAASANYGQRPFTYTPPTGFVALNTFNLPTPTIGATASSQANKYMNVVTYTGTGSTRTVTGVGFQPDFLWIKNRSAATDNYLYDVIRGAGYGLYSNLTSQEVFESNQMSAFTSDGFTVNTAQATNGNTNSLVAWNWKANGTGVTNTAGSITSTVSANTTSGFSVVTYTGNGSSADIGHGLGVAPKMIIAKSRTVAQNWAVYHASIGNNKWLQLNSTSASITEAIWQNSDPTSTVFKINGNSIINTNGSTSVAYCFAEVAGFSKFGSYTGNGSSDGTFVFTGFRPAFVLTKCSSTTGNWMITDDARNPYNLAGEILMPNNSDTEYSQDGIDILSNGFKLRASTSNRNTNGATYIYMAFAEVPQKFSLGR